MLKLCVFPQTAYAVRGPSGIQEIDSPDPVTPLVPALVPSLVPRAVGEKCPESRFDDWRGYSGAHWSFSIFVFENPLAGARTGGRLKRKNAQNNSRLNVRYEWFA